VGDGITIRQASGRESMLPGPQGRTGRLARVAWMPRRWSSSPMSKAQGLKEQEGFPFPSSPQPRPSSTYATHTYGHTDRGEELEKIKYKTKAGAKKTKRTRKTQRTERTASGCHLLRRHCRGSECSWRCLGTTIDAMGEEAFTGSLHARRFGDA
jgi:hypothetical protein